MPAILDALQQYTQVRIASPDRINFHACMATAVVGEQLIAFDDKSILEVCQGGGLRQEACRKRISDALSVLEVLSRAPRMNSVCPWLIEKPM